MTSSSSTAAFEAFYRSEHPRMLRYFRKKVGPDAAPDLVHETFTRVLRSGALGRIDNPQGYLSRSARNLLIERARKSMRQRTIFVPFDDERDGAAPPEQEWRIEARDVRRACWQALRAMPPRTRRVFLMHRVRHLTYKQIAEHLGIGDQGVEYHMMRALARCRAAVVAQQ